MKVENPCSIEKVRKIYLPIIESVKDIYVDRFGQSLTSLYLVGSAGRGEDVPDVSDLDFIGIIDRDVTKEDKQFLEDKEKELKDQAKIDISAISSASLTDDEVWQFVIDTDGLLISGKKYQPTMESPVVGPELARLLAKEFPGIYNKQIERLKQVQTPEWYTNQSRFLAKKTLRLLGLCATTKGRVYSRTVEEVPGLVENILPEHAKMAKNLLELRTNPDSTQSGFEQLFKMTEKVYALAKEIGVVEE